MSWPVIEELEQDDVFLSKEGTLLIDEYIGLVDHSYQRYKIILGKASKRTVRDYKEEDPNLAYSINRLVEIIPESNLVAVKVYYQDPGVGYGEILFIYFNGKWFEVHE